MKITIPGNPVTKKNSQRIYRLSNGKHMIAPSKRFEEYQSTAGLYIHVEARLKLSERVNVKCVYYMQTKRRVDLVNLLEATCDILVHYGVLEDDNSKIVVSHDGSRVLLSKENPRTEIYISAIDEQSNA